MTDTELEGLLRQSKPTVKMPPTFQTEVWRRIAMAEEGADCCSEGEKNPVAPMAEWLISNR